MGDGGDHARPGGPSSAVELESEENVGELRAAVRQPLAVGALPLEIVEVHATDLVAEARDRHDAASGPRLQLRQEESGQRVVTEMVGAQLHLESLGCRPALV